MALKIFKFSPKGGEKKVLSYLEKIYKGVERDIYIISDNLLSYDSGISFKPDFVVLDPLYGISIIEVKSYNPHNISKIDNFEIHFANGEKDVSPFKKCQEYAFKMCDYLKAHGLKISPQHIKSNLIFTNLKPNFFGEYNFVNTHYKNFKKTLKLETMFSNTELQKEILNDIYKKMNPIIYFNTNKEVEKLDDSQLDFVRRPIGGHYLISGIPGSGKSIAVVSRAIFISNEHPDWKILVLSENRNLKDKNEKAIMERTRNLEAYGHDPKENIQCLTLMKFLQNMASQETLSNLPPLYPDKIRALTDALLKTDISPIYDAVLIDEYQDFADDHLRIAKMVAKKKNTIINNEKRFIENLFLSGDKLQKIKEEGGSENWIGLGIEIAGRSKKLKGSYRCGKGILDVSLNFLQSQSKTLKKEVESYYEGLKDIEYISDFNGSISTFTGWKDTGLAKLENWVRALTSKNINPKNILIITPNNKSQLREVQSIFREEVRRGLTIGMPSNVKGLEADYCAIFNFDGLGYHQKYEVNKYKEIYMCLTRARAGIFINTWKQGNKELKKINEIIDSMSKSKAA